MHKSLGLSLVICGTIAATACTVTPSKDAPADAGVATPDAGEPDSATVDDGGATGPLPFRPSNVDLSGIDVSKLGAFVVDGDACTISTDSSLASCGEGAGDILAFKIATQSDGSKVAVYAARSMTIQAGMNLTVTGALPFVFIALDTITIAGTLNANAKNDVGTAGGPSLESNRTKGAGPGGGGSGTATAAGGGGSHCGSGGAGAAESGAASAVSPAYGKPEISPLVGGSSGGGGDVGSAGSGGGAIQLVAGASITLAAGSSIQVGGGGGGFGGISGQEANGGGSGGSVLLESLAVTVAGTLAANGGGGGAGTSADVGAAPPLDPGGADATPNATAAAGGKAGVGPSSGGNGSAGASINGTAGSFSAGNSGGGGGGGAGRIRIHTKSGVASVTAASISPSLATTCTTQGTVHAL